MANPTRQDVELRAPELKAAGSASAALSGGDFDTIIGDAALFVSVPVFGPMWALAVCWLTAHILTLMNRQAKSGGVGTSGPVSGITVGPVATTFASLSTADQLLWLNQTTYGEAYAAARRTRGARATVL